MSAPEPPLELAWIRDRLQLVLDELRDIRGEISKENDGTAEQLAFDHVCTAGSEISSAMSLLWTAGRRRQGEQRQSVHDGPFYGPDPFYGRDVVE